MTSDQEPWFNIGDIVRSSAGGVFAKRGDGLWDDISEPARGAHPDSYPARPDSYPARPLVKIGTTITAAQEKQTHPTAPASRVEPPKMTPHAAIRILDRYLTTSAPVDRDKTAAAMDRLWELVIKGE